MKNTYVSIIEDELKGNQTGSLEEIFLGKIKGTLNSFFNEVNQPKEENIILIQDQISKLSEFIDYIQQRPDSKDLGNVRVVNTCNELKGELEDHLKAIQTSLNSIKTLGLNILNTPGNVSFDEEKFNEPSKKNKNINAEIAKAQKYRSKALLIQSPNMLLNNDSSRDPNLPYRFKSVGLKLKNQQKKEAPITQSSIISTQVPLPPLKSTFKHPSGARKLN